jgi:hypothetical protein
VSSVYRDPAIAITEVEYSRPEPAAAGIASGIDGHRDCDLLIGRYSYPLVEVGCPPTIGPERTGRRRCYAHSVTEWVDVAWLRILAGETQLAHWPWERLRRLRDELNINVSEPAEQSGEVS